MSAKKWEVLQNCEPHFLGLWVDDLCSAFFAAVGSTSLSGRQAPSHFAALIPVGYYCPSATVSRYVCREPLCGISFSTFI